MMNSKRITIDKCLLCPLSLLFRPKLLRLIRDVLFRLSEMTSNFTAAETDKEQLLNQINLLTSERDKTQANVSGLYKVNEQLTRDLAVLAPRDELSLTVVVAGRPRKRTRSKLQLHLRRSKAVTKQPRRS